MNIFSPILIKTLRRSGDQHYYLQKLASQPEMHRLDKYRNNNDGTFRAYEIYRYRIAYRVTEGQVIILRVRHSSMEPDTY